MAFHAMFGIYLHNRGEVEKSKGKTKARVSSPNSRREWA